jgi:hypothetical protein
MKSRHSSEWLDAMKDEMKSMSTNDVWELVQIPKGAKTVVYNWVYKTKHGSKGNIERFKTRLVEKGFTQREGIDYTKTFLLCLAKTLLGLLWCLWHHMTWNCIKWM